MSRTTGSMFTVRFVCDVCGAFRLEDYGTEANYDPTYNLPDGWRVATLGDGSTSRCWDLCPACAAKLRAWIGSEGQARNDD